MHYNSFYLLIMCLVMCYHAIPVSFLIDTGAGVSLLDTKVWDKTKSVAGKLIVAANYRLVRVDGIPLKDLWHYVLSITNAHFSHKFIVAEGLTTDAILWLDFLHGGQ